MASLPELPHNAGYLDAKAIFGLFEAWIRCLSLSKGAVIPKTFLESNKIKELDNQTTRRAT